MAEASDELGADRDEEGDVAAFVNSLDYGDVEYEASELLGTVSDAVGELFRLCLLLPAIEAIDFPIACELLDLNHVAALQTESTGDEESIIGMATLRGPR